MRVKWDQTAEKFFEGGCSHGMCYTGYDKTADAYLVGQAWNGISGFTDNPSGADEQASYADNIKYISMRGAENYGFTVKCFTYPDNFAGCLGKAVVKDSNSAVVTGLRVSQQAREVFGFAVITQIGNDTKGTEAGETLHIIWNATTSPSSKDYSSLNESPSPSELSFEATANPVDVGTKFKPTCNIEISTQNMNSTELTAYEALKDILFGSDTVTYTQYTGSTEPDDWGSADYYTKDGTTYTKVASGTAYNSSTTYYKGTTADPKLPSPAAVIQALGGVVNDVVAEG